MQQDQKYAAKQAIYILNIFKSTLDACKDVGTVDNFQNMALEWDTGDSFGLTPFKVEFVDEMECDIPVKDVTMVNKVIGV